MKKRAVAFVICLFLMVAFAIIYIFSELYNENDVKPVEPIISDATKFKEEYESINNSKITNNGVEYTFRTLTISDDNPFVYATEDEILKKIDNKESFIVYFGFAECPWCRSIIESVIEEAKNNNIEKIYYVNLTGIRDVYVLDNDTKEPVLSEQGTEGYMKLLTAFDNILDEYTLSYTNKKNKTIKVKVGEKRIMAPTFIFVREGKATLKSTAIPASLKDPYQELDDGIKCEIREQISCLFDQLKKDSLTCSIEEKQC